MMKCMGNCKDSCSKKTIKLTTYSQINSLFQGVHDLLLSTITYIDQYHKFTYTCALAALPILNKTT
jgi:hypothetical protein